MTSFLNPWVVIANSELLEEYYVKIQIPDIISDRSGVLNSQSSPFIQSKFKVPGSNINLVRGIPSNTPSIKQSRSHKSDEESVASASSEEFGGLEVGENQMEGKDLEEFRKDLGQLF